MEHLQLLPVALDQSGGTGFTGHAEGLGNMRDEFPRQAAYAQRTIGFRPHPAAQPQEWTSSTVNGAPTVGWSTTT